MLRHILTIVLLLLPCAGRAGEITPQQSLDRALVAVKAGAFAQARQEMMDIADSGQLSGALCYHLGNSEYRLDQPGMAAVWYYRALLLDPLQAESRQNLRFLHRKTGYPEGTQPWSTEVMKISFLRPSRLALTAGVCGWLALTAAAWLAWWPPPRGRRWPLVTVLCLLPVPILVSGAGLWLSRDRAGPDRIEVVIKDDITAFAAPAEASATVIALPQGTRIIPLESRGAWRYCELPGGDEGEPLRGWIREGVTEPLWPWNAARWS